MSTLYSNILVGIDGSETSMEAFRYGMELAKLSNATLYLIKVVDTRMDPFAPYVIEGALEEEIQDANEDLEKLKEEALNEGIKEVKATVRQGQPRDVLTHSFPERANIDLIVIGATGKGMIGKFLVGSTTSYVVKNANVPVLVVKNPHVEN